MSGGARGECYNGEEFEKLESSVQEEDDGEEKEAVRKGNVDNEEEVEMQSDNMIRNEVVHRAMASDGKAVACDLDDLPSLKAEEKDELAVPVESNSKEEEIRGVTVRPTMGSHDLDVVMAVRTLEAVEKDAHAVSDTLCSLLSSLQSALSKVTLSSVDHLQCYNEVAGCVQEAALDAASKGNRFINTCLRVNEEMKGLSNMAAQLKFLRQIVDQLDHQVSRFVPR